MSSFYLEGLRDVFAFDLHALSHQLQTALVVVHLEEEEEEEAFNRDFKVISDLYSV